MALVPKFNGSNIPLAEWEKRLENAACLYQVPAQLSTELAIISLEVAWLKGLFGENVTIPKLRPRFFVRRQQENKSLPHLMVALQSLWRCLEKRDVCGCVTITASDLLWRDQFVEGMKAGPVRRALQ